MPSVPKESQQINKTMHLSRVELYIYILLSSHFQKHVSKRTLFKSSQFCVLNERTSATGLRMLLFETPPILM